MTSDWPPPRRLTRWTLFLRRPMNRIAIIEQPGNPRFDIVVEGRRLAEHFAGRQGSHPAQVIPIGWKDADRRHELSCFFEQESTLSSSPRRGGAGKPRATPWEYFIFFLSPQRGITAVAVGVGILIAGHPLHGSGRAELPHPALVSGHNRKSPTQAIPGIQMTDSRVR